MPSIDDVFNELQKINTNLQTVQGELTQINTTLNTGFSNVLGSMQTLVTLETYSDLALAQLSKEGDTIICILEKISQQSCAQLNEAHTQTGLQSAIQESSATLLELYKFTNPAAALEFERLEHLRKQLAKCCPPSEPDPFCAYQPCEAPLPLPDPPSGGPTIS